MLFSSKAQQGIHDENEPVEAPSSDEKYQTLVNDIADQVIESKFF